MRSLMKFGRAIALVFGVIVASFSTAAFAQSLSTAKTVNNGDAAPAFSAGALTVTFQ